eukprot:6320992-Pyramimonas_sp.AAC.1
MFMLLLVPLVTRADTACVPSAELYGVSKRAKTAVGRNQLHTHSDPGQAHPRHRIGADAILTHVRTKASTPSLGQRSAWPGSV